MIVFFRTDRFDRWLRRLRDPRAKARVLVRLEAASLGNFGDTRSVGNGIFEMRIHAGPGYRIYYLRCGEQIYLLLAGGRKSTQDSDIHQAQIEAAKYKEEPH